jgi:hypothetical protein
MDYIEFARTLPLALRLVLASAAFLAFVFVVGVLFFVPAPQKPDKQPSAAVATPNRVSAPPIVAPTPPPTLFSAGQARMSAVDGTVVRSWGYALDVNIGEGEMNIRLGADSRGDGPSTTIYFPDEHKARMMPLFGRLVLIEARTTQHPYFPSGLWQGDSLDYLTADRYFPGAFAAGTLWAQWHGNTGRALDEAQRHWMRARNSVTELLPQQSDLDLRDAPRGSFGFADPRSLLRDQRSPRLQRRAYRHSDSFELHKLSDGTTWVIGFTSEESAARLAQESGNSGLRFVLYDSAWPHADRCVAVSTGRVSLLDSRSIQLDSGAGPRAIDLQLH